MDRSVVGNERVPGGFHSLFGILRRMDDAGRCQQVYAVEGLGGAQFASSAALEQLRQTGSVDPVLLATTDPANPMGVTVPWPEVTGGRPQRKAGSLVLMGGAGPLFYLDSAGRSLLAWSQDVGAAGAFVTAVQARRRKVSLRKINGEDVFSSPFSSVFTDAGLHLTPSGLR
ncbi:MAG: hypothetical protein V9E82_15985 [Candidatus Nanopelagicales bacterium]